MRHTAFVSGNVSTLSSFITKLQLDLATQVSSKAHTITLADQDEHHMQFGVLVVVAIVALAGVCLYNRTSKPSPWESSDETVNPARQKERTPLTSSRPTSDSNRCTLTDNRNITTDNKDVIAASSGQNIESNQMNHQDATDANQVDPATDANQVDPDEKPGGCRWADQVDQTNEVDDDEEEVVEKLKPFDGPLVKAFEMLTSKNQLPRDDEFLSLQKLLKDKVQLCDDSTFFPQGMSVGDIFPILYGAGNALFSRYHERRNDKNLRARPPRPLVREGAPWGAVATLTCEVPVPVLGNRSYKEVQRLVLCCQNGETTLAVQTLGKVQAGWVGEFISENLYLYSQFQGKPIRFQAMAPTPKGSFASSALNGHKKSLEDFQAVAREILKSWRPRTRRNREGPVSVEKFLAATDLKESHR